MMVGCIPEVLMLVLTPILTYIYMVYVKNVIYDIFDTYDIWHMTYINMSIWVSKEALEPQECSQPSYISYKIVFRAKN